MWSIVWLSILVVGIVFGMEKLFTGIAKEQAEMAVVEQETINNTEQKKDIVQKHKEEEVGEVPMGVPRDIPVQAYIDMDDVAYEVRDAMKSYPLVDGKWWRVRRNGAYNREVDVDIRFIGANNELKYTGKNYIEVFISSDRKRQWVKYRERGIGNIARDIATKLDNKYGISLRVETDY